MSILNISEYTTLGMIARGQNPVLKVRNLYTKKEYALKKVKRLDYSQHLSDFQEILYISSCSHPNIIKILGFSISHSKAQGHNEYFINLLMDLMEKNLAEEVLERKKNNNFFSKQELFSLTKKLLDALYFMQINCKIAHRDIKPENILINKEKEIFLSDFSEAFLSNEMRKTAKTLVGSPYYMSPELKEQYLNDGNIENFEYNPWKSDVFSLGMTLIDVATLSIGEKIGIEKKLEIIEKIYGKEFKKFFENCIEIDVFKRSDFKDIMQSNIIKKLEENIENISEIMIESVNLWNNEDKELKISNKLYSLIEKLPKREGSNKLYNFLTRVRKLEEEKKLESQLNLKKQTQSEKNILEKNNNNNTDPEIMFKSQIYSQQYLNYWDCQ